MMRSDGPPHLDRRSLQLTLVSTFTEDHLPGKNGHVRVQQGGPAHYMGAALERLGVPFHLVTGPTAVVEVIPGADGERYVIPKLHPISLTAPLRGDAVILSPVMREILPEAVPPVDGLLALDLQGFVRRPLDPGGGLDRDVDLAGLLCRTHIVKASEPELRALTGRSRDAMANAAVLVTRGRDGATIQCGGSSETIVAMPVAAPNTIGAGDTFLSAFIVSVLEGASTREAGERAARFTEDVLRDRLTP